MARIANSTTSYAMIHNGETESKQKMIRSDMVLFIICQIVCLMFMFGHGTQPSAAKKRKRQMVFASIRNRYFVPCAPKRRYASRLTAIFWYGAGTERTTIYAIPRPKPMVYLLLLFRQYADRRPLPPHSHVVSLYVQQRSLSVTIKHTVTTATSGQTERKHTRTE